MKIFSILFVLFTASVAHAQIIFNFKKDMVWIENAKLFVCKYEVTNSEYRTFTSDLLKDTLRFPKKEIYSNYYPDTTLWIKEFNHGMGHPMHDYYYWWIPFSCYPVAGVPYDGAVKYCEWLTQKYGDGKYKFRLPTKKEFLAYAKVGYTDFGGGIEEPRDEKGKYLFNCKPDRINMDDSISKVFYDPGYKAFLRCYDDPATDHDESLGPGIKGFDYHFESSYNDYLYLSDFSKVLKYKMTDSLPFYDLKTKTYHKEKLVLSTHSNYYDDGYMYTSSTRWTDKFSANLFSYDINFPFPDKPLITKANKSTFPADKNGLFDLNGNLSELVSERGYIMGGNWNCDIKDCFYDIERRADDVHQILIGFRIVAEKL